LSEPYNLKYRPDIDGLRAIAVVSVILFHTHIGCPGGYVGVDVFFVISGYLITALLWRDMQSGTFTFVEFWERRARRIAPALLFVTLATLIAGYLLLLPMDLRGLGRAIVAQSLFAANINYWQLTGYFNAGSDDKPLLHMWSLAVEEQFYLVAPLVLWAICRAFPARRKQTIVATILVLIAASLALSIHGVRATPSAAFFLLPSRAWELLLGSIVVFLPVSQSLSVSGRARHCVALAGLTMIVAPIFAYTKQTSFPGLAAVPPCLGAALLIWVHQSGRTVVSGIMSLRPVVFVGLISYSLYLWHWPLLVYMQYYCLTPLTLLERLIVVLLSVLCGTISWKYVESPFRLRHLGKTRRAMLGTTVVGLSVISLMGLACFLSKGFPQRLSEEQIAFDDSARELYPIDARTEMSDVINGTFTAIGAKKSQPKIFVWGDSHAGALIPAIDQFLTECGIGGLAASLAGAPPLLDWYVESEWNLGTDVPLYNKLVLDFIRQHQIPHVLLVGQWPHYESMTTNNRQSVDEALLQTVRCIKAFGAQPWILLSVPTHSFDVPRALNRTGLSGKQLAADVDQPDGIRPETIALIKMAGGMVIDPKPRFLDVVKNVYVIQSNGVALYRDKNHLTVQGAQLMLLPLFRESLTINWKGN